MIRPSAVATARPVIKSKFYGDNGEHRAPSVYGCVQVSSVVFLFHIGEHAVASALSDIKSPSLEAGKDYTQQLHGGFRGLLWGRTTVSIRLKQVLVAEPVCLLTRVRLTLCWSRSVFWVTSIIRFPLNSILSPIARSLTSLYLGIL